MRDLPDFKIGYYIHIMTYVRFFILALFGWFLFPALAFASPVITNVYPATILPVGHPVTVVGTGFSIGAGGVKMDPSGAATLITLHGTSTVAYFTAPAHSAGAVTFRFYAPGGTDGNGQFTDQSITYAAGTWVVTTTADHNDGTCDADCTLREAVAHASSGDVIDATGISGTITMAAGGMTKNLLGALTIIGPGSGTLTINGGATHTIFGTENLENFGAVPFVISGFTFTNAPQAFSVDGNVGSKLIMSDCVFNTIFEPAFIDSRTSVVDTAVNAGVIITNSQFTASETGALSIS